MKKASSLLSLAFVFAIGGTSQAFLVPNGDFTAQGPGASVGAPPTPGFVPDFTISDPNGQAAGVLANNDPLNNGTNDGFINGGGAALTNFTTDSLSTSIAASTTYTLTIDLGFNPTNGSGYDVPADVNLGFVTSSTVGGVTTYTMIGSTTVSAATIAAGTNGLDSTSGTPFTEETYSFTTDASGFYNGVDLTNNDLEAQFSSGMGSGNSQTLFDDVRVTADPVSTPEPSTYAMLFCGVAVLAMAFRHKQALR